MARFADVAQGNRVSRVQWETREVSMPANTTRAEARTLLTEFAEYGQWELARSRVYLDGRRWALLRRRKMTNPRTGLADLDE